MFNKHMKMCSMPFIIRKWPTKPQRQVTPHTESGKWVMPNADQAEQQPEAAHTAGKWDDTTTWENCLADSLMFENIYPVTPQFTFRYLLKRNENIRIDLYTHDSGSLVHLQIGNLKIQQWVNG